MCTEIQAGQQNIVRICDYHLWSCTAKFCLRKRLCAYPWIAHTLSNYVENGQLCAKLYMCIIPLSLPLWFVFYVSSTNDQLVRLLYRLYLNTYHHMFVLFYSFTDSYFL